jgi:hypothetical protein
MLNYSYALHFWRAFLVFAFYICCSSLINFCFNAMKKISFRFVLISSLLLSSVSALFAWGVWGHQHINHAAVFALPDSMRVFFFDHIDYMTEEAAVPDIRKYAIGDKTESYKHYIDIEAYGDHPFEALPETWDAAKEKYTEDTLNKYGILPWWVEHMETELTNAFKEKRVDAILFLAADLGHYVADATMPLHTSINYDGQFTGQRGIHAFWESQLPELFGNSYNFHVAPAHYLPDVNAEIWNIIKESHGQIDSLLTIEKRLHASFPPDKIYKTNSNGKIIKNSYGEAIHSYAYAKAYHDALHGQVENQLRYAIQEVADFWYTAWVNAGRPDLTDLDAASITKQNKKLLQKEYKLWLKGRLWGFKSSPEF